MMTWTLYLLLVTGDGWEAWKSRTFTSSKECAKAVKYLQGKDLKSGKHIYAAVCKETLDV